jgi:type IV secretion system protein VirB11
MISSLNKQVQEENYRAISVNFLLSPLQYWLNDPSITEICINRPYEIFCETQGKWSRHENSTLSLAHLHSLATAIARFAQNDISDTNPILSAQLPHGERIQIVFPPACEADSISITIRKPSQAILALEEYETQQFFAHIRPIHHAVLPEEEALMQLKETKQYRVFLEQAVKLGKVVVVAGSTGSGKTTLMKSLMQVIPTHERLITIEDVPELFLPKHPNHVHLFYPSENSEEQMTFLNATTLLRSCLRMKPDRILLAELRGGETFDFINIAASGHGGSITSLHAGSVALAFERLTLMMLQNPQGRKLPVAIIRRLLYQVIDIVVHIHNRTTDGRHITELWYEPQKKYGAFMQSTQPENTV